MEQAELKQELKNFIKENAIMKGERTLASGKKSGVYIDGKQVTLNPHGLLLVGKVILNEVKTLQAHAIGGPTLGADPIAAVVSLLSGQTAHPLKAFIVRKEAKQHGMQKMIEGPPIQAGDHVIMVEDVITTGGSVLKAIHEVEALKAKVVKVICLVDRAEGAEKVLEAYNYSPLFSLQEIIN